MSYYQQIYNRLRGHGMTQAGALGVLGNWECESNCEPYRVQGDFSSSRRASHLYVQSVECRELSKDQFSNDAKGFGLAQWTYCSRKEELYDYWQKNKLANLDTTELQVDFAVKEFKRDFSKDWQLLCSTVDIREAADAVCARFENPQIHNVDARYHAALRIMGMIDLSGSQKPEPADSGSNGGESEETGEDKSKPAAKLQLRTIDEHASGWPEVWLLQAALALRGYQVLHDGIFGKSLTEKVKQFQADADLGVDGIVGPMTWAKLLETERR